MGGPQDVSSSRGQSFYPVPDLPPDFLGRSEGEGALDRDPSLERERIPEVRLEGPRVHVLCFGLEGLEHVQAAVQHEGYELSYGAACVVHDLNPVAVGQFYIPPEPLHQELLPHRGGDEGALLGAEVVPRKKDVKFAPCRLQYPLLVLQVEAPYMREYSVGHLGEEGHIYKYLLHAPEVHRWLELGYAVEPVAHEDRHLPLPVHLLALGPYPRVVEPIRGGPAGVRFHLLHGPGGGQGRGDHLPVGLGLQPLPHRHPHPRNPPEVLLAPVRKLPQWRADVPWALYVPEVNIVEVK